MWLMISPGRKLRFGELRALVARQRESRRAARPTDIVVLSDPFAEPLLRRNCHLAARIPERILGAENQ